VACLPEADGELRGIIEACTKLYHKHTDGVNAYGDKWKREKEEGKGDNHIIVHSSKALRTTKEDGKNVLLFRSKGVVHATPEVVFRYLTDLEIRQRWDAAVVNGGVKKEYRDGIQIIHLMIKPGPLAKRDFVDIRRVWNVDGVWLSVNRSLKRDKTKSQQARVSPEEAAVGRPGDGIVRGANYPGGLTLTPLEGGRSTMVVVVTQSDIKGSLPMSLLKSAIAGGMVDGIKTLRKVCVRG
jgi:hypothetical protein